MTPQRPPRIMVIGEPLIDAYHLASTSRISPESPIPVFKVEETFRSQGGAANVAAQLKRLGAFVEEVYPEGPWPVKNRLMCGGVQVARWDEADSLPPFKTNLLGPGVSYYDAVVISDYGKGAFTPEARKGIWEALQAYPGKVFIDTKASPEAWSSYGEYHPIEALSPPWTFFPNSNEYATHERAYCSTQHVVRTLGAGGMEYLYYGARKHFEPSQARQVRSVIGAGDCVLAAYAYQAALGGSPAECLAFAAQKAGEKVERPYTL